MSQKSEYNEAKQDLFKKIYNYNTEVTLRTNGSYCQKCL